LRHLLVALALALVAFAIYAVALDGPFIYDDVSTIRDNPAVRVTALDFTQLRDSASGPVGRPLAYLSFGLNHYFGGYETRGYHAVNVAIHATTGFLVYLLARLTFQLLCSAPGRRRPSSAALTLASLFAAVLFVVHPVQTQAVTYVVQRMTSMASCFYLLALLLYVLGRQRSGGYGRWSLWAAGGGAWLLSLASKEIAVSLPAAVLLYEWAFFQDLDTGWLRRRLGLAAGLLALLLAVVLSYLGASPVDRILAEYEHYPFSLRERLLTEPRVLVFYLSLLLWPAPARLDLVPDVPLSGGLLDPPATLLSMLFLAGMLAVAVLGARRWRLLSFSILWFFLQLGIESSFWALDIAFEHRLYLPMFGVALLVASPLVFAAGMQLRVRCVGACVLLALLGAATHVRNRVWTDSVGFWSDSVAKSPASARAHTNLGVALLGVGRANPAAEEFVRALELNPGDRLARHNLAIALVAAGRQDEALELGAVTPQEWQRQLDGALHVAVERGDPAQTRELIARGARVDARRAEGWEPLHVAARQGDEATCSVLLDAGAEVGARGPQGVTPLHRAARRGHMGVVVLLLERGARGQSETEKGETPVDFALRGSHREVANTLREAVAP
jgi:tetratricopeptide (TPR) repeat protein